MPLPNPWPRLNVSCHTRGDSATPYARGVNCRHILHQRYPRRYVVWVPALARARMRVGRRVPMVVMLHGTSGDGERFLRISGWKEKASREGFIAVFPSGLTYTVTNEGPPHRTTKWNHFELNTIIDPTVRPPGWPRAAVWPADDIGFLQRMVGAIRRRLQIDRRRVFLSGFSNGAQMCSRAGIQLSDVFAAVGCNVGPLERAQVTTAGNRNVPMFMTFGNKDDRLLTPYQQAVPGATELPLDPAQVESVFDRVLDTTTSSIALERTRTSTAQRRTFTQLGWTNPAPGNSDGNSLYLLLLDEVVHLYPNGRARGNPLGFRMTDFLWPFFRANPLP